MLLQYPEYKEKVLDLLQKADLSIQDLNISKVNIPEEAYINSPFKEKIMREKFDGAYQISTSHIVRDDNGDYVEMKNIPYTLESMGTKRIFELAYAILNTIDESKVIYIDEFETYLHPKECELLLSLFKNTDAQLIINTHNINLLNNLERKTMRLINKNNFEESTISTAPKDIRNDDKNLAKKYEIGAMGGIPNVRIK
jgi:AAA15 family ATPase/GTPase